jgi:hypothetical protein
MTRYRVGFLVMALVFALALPACKPKMPPSVATTTSTVLYDSEGWNLTASNPVAYSADSPMVTFENTTVTSTDATHPNFAFSTVLYTIWTAHGCPTSGTTLPTQTVQITSGGPTNGMAPNSTAQMLNGPGPYSYQATYSGDTGSSVSPSHDPSSSTCQDFDEQ